MPLAFVATTNGAPTILVTIDGAGHAITAFVSAADQTAIVDALPGDIGIAHISRAQYDELYRIAGAGETS